MYNFFSNRNLKNFHHKLHKQHNIYSKSDIVALEEKNKIILQIKTFVWYKTKYFFLRNCQNCNLHKENLY